MPWNTGAPLYLLTFFDGFRLLLLSSFIPIIALIIWGFGLFICENSSLNAIPIPFIFPQHPSLCRAMDGRQQSTEPLRGAAAVACVSCRRMKVCPQHYPLKQGMSDYMAKLADERALFNTEDEMHRRRQPTLHSLLQEQSRVRSAASKSAKASPIFAL